MAIAYRAEPSVGCTFDVWDGEIGDEEVQQYLVRLASDRSWPPGHSHLTDLTTLGSTWVPDAVVLDALYEGTGLAEDLNVAVIVSVRARSDLELEYATVNEKLTAKVFTELAVACAYLGVDEATARVILDELRESLRGTDPAE